MPVILHLETATAVCSAAISRDGALLAVRETDTPQAHAAMLAVYVQELLVETGLAPGQLDAVSYSAGPGSYTGLRIGISTAKGLCWAADKPLLAVPTLEALAQAALPQARAGERIIPLLDARRMEVYAGVFDHEGRPVGAVKPVILDEASFLHELDAGPVWFLGDGLAKAQPLLARHPQARFLPDAACSARHQARLALQAFQAGRFEHLALSEPFYLKEFVAGKGSVAPGEAQG